MTNTALRVISVEAMIRIPAAATVPNINKVAPPKTGSGISENTLPTTGKSPKRTKAPAMK